MKFLRFFANERFLLSFAACRNCLIYSPNKWQKVLLIVSRFHSHLRSKSLVLGAGTTGTALSLSWTFGNVATVDPSKEATSKGGNLKTVVVEADKLYDSLRYKTLYDLLVGYKNVVDDEIKWRLARATYEMSKLASTKEEKLKLLKEAKEYVYEALDINGENFASHKWAAILVVELAEQEGTKAKIQQSVVSKDHMMKAHSLNPTDGTTLYLLGVWCFSFAELSWSQRQLASLIFAKPPTSTFQEALDFFLKAEAVQPNFYSKNLLMLGKTYLQLSEKEKAVVFLTKARDYPLKTDEDKEAKEEAIKLLKGLGVN